MTEQHRLSFESLDQAIETFFWELGRARMTTKVKSSTKTDYKEEIAEIHPAFFSIKNAVQCISTWGNAKTHCFWGVSEVMSEVMGLNPHLMEEYKPEIMSWAYKLQPDRRIRYTYGARLQEFNQVLNTFEKFKENLHTKKAVMQIYMPYDTHRSLDDVPCNCSWMFLVRNGIMDMTVVARSIDFFGGLIYDPIVASTFLQMFCSWLSAEGKVVVPGKIYFYYNSLHFYPKKDEAKFCKLQEEINDWSKDKERDKLSYYFPVISISDFYTDMHRILDAERAAYFANFEAAEEKMEKISLPVFRDFARVYLNRNLKREYETDKNMSEYETDLFKKWNGRL